MEDYKHTVFKGENFEFQNADLEDSYAKFVKAKKETDQKHHDDKRDHEKAKGEYKVAE
jgi:hypothetical protein